MKLGKPKRYTLFRSSNVTSKASLSPCNSSTLQSHPVIIPTIMANSSSQHQQNLVTSMSTWLLVPRGRNFRHILATVLCVILVYHVTLLAIPTNSIPSSNGAPAAAALSLCEACEEDDVLVANNQISQPQNRNVNINSYNKGNEHIPIVGTSVKTGSQGSMSKNNEVSSSQFHAMQSTGNGDNTNKKFAPPSETSGNNYNYYYTDEISNGNRGNRNNNYDINIPSGSVAESDSDNADSTAYRDNQAATTKPGDDNDESGHANRDAMDSNDNSNRFGNAMVDKSNSHSVHVKETISTSKIKTMTKATGQSEKRANKKLLKLQYQHRRKLLDSVFLSIKSTKRFHKTRLEPVITTWFNLARDQEEISFWFATGGAGFCLSRALATRMIPVASGGKFTKLCDNIQLPDDVTMGYIAGHLLGRNLTVIPQFHSHYETMRFLDMKNPYPEITFSYVRYFDNSLNTLEIDGFSEDEDPTRFLSLHCLLFPNFSFCPKGNKR